MTITSYQQIMEFNSTISCSAFYKRRLVAICKSSSEGLPLRCQTPWTAASLRWIRKRGGVRGLMPLARAKQQVVNLYRPGLLTTTKWHQHNIMDHHKLYSTAAPESRWDMDG